MHIITITKLCINLIITNYYAPDHQRSALLNIEPKWGVLAHSVPAFSCRAGSTKSTSNITGLVNGHDKELWLPIQNYGTHCRMVACFNLLEEYCNNNK